MLYLLSPAKTQHDDVKGYSANSALLTSPELADDATVIAAKMASLPVSRLRELLHLSPALGEIAAARAAAWSAPDTKSLPAAFVYDGPAYRALDARTLSKSELGYIQDHLMIICGLYGALRPMDVIRQYRLEMSTKLSVKDGAKDLYSFWADRIARVAVARATAHRSPSGDAFIINVASEEYATAVLKWLPSVSCERDKIRLVNIRFPGASVHAKAARGGIVRYAARVNAKDPVDLQGFTGDAGELSFDADASTESEYVFIRGAPQGRKPSKRARKGEESLEAN